MGMATSATVPATDNDVDTDYITDDTNITAVVNACSTASISNINESNDELNNNGE